MCVFAGVPKRKTTFGTRGFRSTSVRQSAATVPDSLHRPSRSRHPGASLVDLGTVPHTPRTLPPTSMEFHVHDGKLPQKMCVKLLGSKGRRSYSTTPHIVLPSMPDLPGPFLCPSRLVVPQASWRWLVGGSVSLAIGAAVRSSKQRGDVSARNFDERRAFGRLDAIFTNATFMAKHARTS